VQGGRAEQSPSYVRPRSTTPLRKFAFVVCAQPFALLLLHAPAAIEGSIGVFFGVLSSLKCCRKFELHVPCFE